jgi:hypothetical protein
MSFPSYNLINCRLQHVWNPVSNIDIDNYNILHQVTTLSDIYNMTQSHHVVPSMHNTTSPSSVSTAMNATSAYLSLDGIVAGAPSLTHTRIASAFLLLQLCPLIATTALRISSREIRQHNFSGGLHVPTQSTACRCRRPRTCTCSGCRICCLWPMTAR